MTAKRSKHASFPRPLLKIPQRRRQSMPLASDAGNLGEAPSRRLQFQVAFRVRQRKSPRKHNSTRVPFVTWTLLASIELTMTGIYLPIRDGTWTFGCLTLACRWNESSTKSSNRRSNHEPCACLETDNLHFLSTQAQVLATEEFEILNGKKLLDNRRSSSRLACAWPSR